MAARRRYWVQRFDINPIIHPAMAGFAPGDGENINGPSLIRVPSWITNPLGKYYLYFAHHKGAYIRMAYADHLAGPWTILPGGVLHIAQGPGYEHIGSPDVHVDHDARTIRMYFHQPATPDARRQVSYVALSSDGLTFAPRGDDLGDSYFRVFQWRGHFYALAKHGNVDGVLLQSRDGLRPFEPGPHFLPGIRHTAIWRDGEELNIIYSLVGEAPERLYHTTCQLSGDWRTWSIQPGPVLLEPERDYEGANLPLIPSKYGPIHGPARQLRDPAIYEEAGRRYLLYSVAGEQGIAIGELSGE